MTYDYQLFPDTGKGANTGECGSIPRIITAHTSFNDCTMRCSAMSDCGYMSFTVGQTGNDRGFCLGYSKRHTCTPDRAYYNNMSSYRKIAKGSAHVPSPPPSAESSGESSTQSIPSTPPSAESSGESSTESIPSTPPAPTHVSPPSNKWIEGLEWIESVDISIVIAVVVSAIVIILLIFFAASR